MHSDSLVERQGELPQDLEIREMSGKNRVKIKMSGKTKRCVDKHNNPCFYEIGDSND